MIILEAILPKKAILLYRKTTDYSTISYIPINLYEAWNKPEKAKEWREKLLLTEDKIE
jgi:hypothetical protein